MSSNLPKINGDLELVVLNDGIKLSRYQKNEVFIKQQKKAIEDLIAVIDDTSMTVSNILVLESYAKTLTTLKNKIDKQRKSLREDLNKEGDIVHKFYNTTFIKPLEEKIKQLKETVQSLATPYVVEVIEEGSKKALNLPTHHLEFKSDYFLLAKVLEFLQKLDIKYRLDGED